MKTQQKNLLTVMMLLLSMLNAYGQDIMSIEQEREIKVSGKYYFGECMSFDEAEAKDCALKELTQEVIVSVLQQALIEKNEALLKNLEMKANTARLPMTGRIRILAYIAKDSIYVQGTSAENNAVVPPEVPDQKTQPQQTATKLTA